jgi:hypothetical protein
LAKTYVGPQRYKSAALHLGKEKGRSEELRMAVVLKIQTPQKKLPMNYEL